MAVSSYSCSVGQGFNFQKDEQVLVGHIVYLKIGESELKADLNVTNPEDVSKLVKVVGIVSQMSWEGGYAEPIQFNCQVSTDNKNTLATLTHKDMSNTEVLFKFAVFDYDPKAKKYFKCFHSGDEQLKGLVQKSGGDLAMYIDMDQSMEVASPKNYSFSLGIMPQDKNMAIQMAVSTDAKFAKKWGVEVAA